MQYEKTYDKIFIAWSNYVNYIGDLAWESHGKSFDSKNHKEGVRRRVERGTIMLLAKKETYERINVLSKKPMIRKNTATGEMAAGFLDPQTGVFELALKINDERDIDRFLDDYDLSVVMISKM